MAQFIVILDSCVLYPAPLRDLLMRLALTDFYLQESPIYFLAIYYLDDEEVKFGHCIQYKL